MKVNHLEAISSKGELNEGKQSVREPQDGKQSDGEQPAGEQSGGDRYGGELLRGEQSVSKPTGG